MRMMSGHSRGGSAQDGSAHSDEQVAELRDQVNRLLAELRAREQPPREAPRSTAVD